MSSAGPSGPSPDLELRSLRAEHEQLLAENLEYMGVLSRYARALGLCATLSPDALAERIVEGLCLETRAQGGLLWMAEDGPGSELSLVSVRGVVKAHDEPERLAPDALPAALAAERHGEPGESLSIPLRHGGRLLALARVRDRIDAERFDARDATAAEQFAEVAALALGNAVRFRDLERRSLRDPRTQAFTLAFFDGVVATEIEKAHRFGRHFSLVEVELSGLASVRRRLGEDAASVFVDGFAGRLQQALRGTDLCAADGEGRYRLLLAETDALGAAVLKRRLRTLVEPAVASGSGDTSIRIASATFPDDGTRLDALRRRLARRLDDEGRSPARALERESRSFAESRRRLLRDAGPVPPQLPEQALRFVLDEVRRREHERGLVWISPGAGLHAITLDELARLRGRPVRADITLLCDDDGVDRLGLPVTRIPSRRAGTRAPFLVYLGETPAYACLRERDGDGAPFYHTSDRSVVEHLAFELQRDLGRPGALS